MRADFYAVTVTIVLMLVLLNSFYKSEVYADSVPKTTISYYSVSQAVQGTDVLYYGGKALMSGSYGVLKTGDHVLFGAYEQDGIISNGREEIEWLVLDVKGSEALLISRYGLEAVPYNDPGNTGKLEGTTWRQSSLRTWLNKDKENGFLNTAFSDKEKARILVSEVTAEINSVYLTDPGADTKDKVFLLSTGEAQNYFKTDDSRRCSATAYAENKMKLSESFDTYWWWLRTPGATNESVSCVKSDGTAGIDALRRVNNTAVLVRPAIRITLSDENEIVVKTRAQSDSINSIKRVIPSLFPGDTISFGTYQKSELEWRVLEVREGKALVISEKVIDAQLYHGRNKNMTWHDCRLRNWLNETFFSSAFSNKDRSRLLTADITASANPAYSTDPGDDTKDRLFLLSADEANQYFINDSGRMCKPTAFALEQGAKSGLDDNTSWWLRTPGESSEKAVVVYDDGTFNYAGENVGDTVCGVRPAFWINLTF